MKKITFLFSAMVMAASLTACGNNAASTTEVPSSQAETSAVTSEAESQT